MSLGFQKAGFEIVSAFDNWDQAIEVYRANFSHPIFKMNLMDVERAVDSVSAYNPDMIIGGPPCQDFSSAGKRDEDNGRGDLTVAFAKIVAQVRPQWFVMENVARIVKTRKLEEASRILKMEGYGLTKMVLNASKCGVPQKRMRFFMIGKIGEDDDFLSNILISSQSDKEMTVADYFGDKLDVEYYYRHPRSYARRGIFSVHEPSPTIRGVNRPMPTGYQIHPTDPIVNKEGIRPLTTKERSEIQTFPEEFRFVGTKTNIEQMIGNAVPVNLARFVGCAINNYVGEPVFDNSRDYSIPLTTLWDASEPYGSD